ncbi:MAG: histidine phosphatase family protein [Pseudomonadota bacterium]
MGAVYLVRHGQASFGKADYDRLSELGVEQAQLLGHALRSRLPALDALYSGSMLRHRQTAEHCVAGLGEAFGRLPEPVIRAGFNEFDHEEVVVRLKPLYANKLLMAADLAKTLNPRRAFQQVFEEAVARWVSGLHDDEYAESWPSFRNRCVTSLQEVVAELGASKTALVFTSGGTITAICQHLLGMPDDTAFRLNHTLANCGLTKVIYSERGLYVSTVNEHAHFEMANLRGGERKLITYR